MKIPPFFTIVIPTFNSETTLQRCLDSIILQTFTDYEVLIIDGVSLDNTLEIAKNFDDSRIKILSKPDNGIYDAMNKGIALAKGKWIYFLGSDDILYSKDVLMRINDVAYESNNYVIYGNVMIDDVRQQGRIYDGIFSLEKLLSQNICHQSVFYKNEIFKRIGDYNINYSVNADWDLNLRCRAMFQFQYVDFIIAFFSSGGHSTTGSNEFFFQNYLDNVARYFFWQFYKKDFDRIIFKALKGQLKEKHFGYAVGIFVQMILFHPIILISKIKRKICSQL